MFLCASRLPSFTPGHWPSRGSKSQVTAGIENPVSNGGPSPEICWPSFCAAHWDHLRPAVGDCQSSGELTVKSISRPSRCSLATEHHRTISSARAVQPDMHRTPSCAHGDHVTTVVSVVFSRTARQSLVPWLFVATMRPAPIHIVYILLGACYVNETAQLRVVSAQQRMD